MPNVFKRVWICCGLLFGLRRHDFRAAKTWVSTMYPGVGFTEDEYPIVDLMDGKRQFIIAGMAGSGSGVSFNAARCICNRILGKSKEDDYPEAYFSPTRLIDPLNHKWPEIEC